MVDRLVQLIAVANRQKKIYNIIKYNQIFTFYVDDTYNPHTKRKNIASSNGVSHDKKII